MLVTPYLGRIDVLEVIFEEFDLDMDHRARDLRTPLHSAILGLDI